MLTTSTTLLLCLPTPLALVCGVSPIIPPLVHQPAYLSITPARSVHKSRSDSVVRMWVYGKCECFVMQMLYVCVLCASCGSSQCCVLHDLQFVNAGRGCKRRPYGRGILQSLPQNCLICSHECLLLFTPSCCSCVRVLRCCRCMCCM